MQSSSASPSGASEWRTIREEYEYIVIGTGAGGGPVAANLAKAGRKVLVLEAGGDACNPTSEFRYSVPGANPRNDVELGWSYWVNSRKLEADRKEQNFYVPGKGLYYPRGTSIGGSTNVNAMIALYPDNDDWSEIAAITGDRSWAPDTMRDFFQRLEQVRYKPPDDDKERHGFSGWLPLEQVGMRGNLFKDPWLANYLVSRLRGEINGDALKAALDSGGDFRIDPNDWSFVSERRTGLVDPPRTSDRGARRGTREMLLKTAEKYRANFRIETDALVTGLIFHETHRTRVIGVRFLSGAHLYGASLLAEQFASRPGIPREVFATREVILAAGAFNSPQILMLSGIGPDEELRKHGIDVRVNLPGVGANLQDRLETGVVVKLPFEPSIYKNCTWGADGDPCLAEYARDDAEYRTRLSRQFYMVQRSDPSRTVPNLVIFGFVGRFRGYYHPSHMPASAVGGKDEFTWFTLSGHRKNTAGRVTLRSASPRDTPEINFNNFEDGNDGGTDLEALLHGVKWARRLAANGGSGPAEGEISPGSQYATDQELRTFIRREAWGHHASCTNKIGRREDPMAVVDGSFRVHGVERLRVVDASVFPRTPGLFIAVPIYMIAEKASDAILADIKD